MATLQVALLAWIDTNVMAEVFTFGDFFRDLLNRDFPAATARRVRVQGSLWMAMALCAQRATTISYLHETSRTVFKIAPPDTRIGLPTVAVFRVLIPGGVFDGWERVETNDAAALGNRARDRYMADECHRRGLVLVSRDAGALSYASSLGVRAVSPEDYARSALSRDDARLMFLRRLDRALLHAAYEATGFPLLSGLTGDEEFDRDHWFLKHLRDVLARYEGTWEWRWLDKNETR